MRALIFDRSLSFRPHQPDVIADGETLVRVCRAGICATDLEIVKGYMGFRGVLGHEFVGEVVQSPEICRRSDSPGRHQQFDEPGLTDVKRAKSFRKPKRHPQRAWFMPFFSR